MKRKGNGLGIVALVIYILGGLSTFGGIGMIVFMGGKDFAGVGEGRSLGWLFLAAGLSMTIIGVLLMRIFRNRWLA
jgi:hypothetical protein